MRIRFARNLWLMRNGDYLPLLCQLFHYGTYLLCRFPTNARIDLIKNQQSKTGATILKLNDASMEDVQKKMLGKASNLK